LPSLLGVQPSESALRAAAIAAALIADAERSGRSSGNGSTASAPQRATGVADSSSSNWAQLARIDGLRDR